MSGNWRKEHDAFIRLADVLVADILELSDDEILAEVNEDGGNAEGGVEDFQALFKEVVIKQGKATLAAAKSAAQFASSQEASVTDIDREKARRKYQSLLTGDVLSTKEMTLAARKGEGNSQRDIESALEDLIELGALDDEDGVE